MLDQILDKNRMIHPDEEAILLLFINRLMNEFRSVSFQLFSDMQRNRSIHSKLVLKLRSKRSLLLMR